MIEDQTPTSIAKTIEAEYKSMTFTKTVGNEHYGSKNPDDLARRNESINEFLASGDMLEPSIAPTKHDAGVIQETIEKYESMLDVLMAQPNRSEEDEILIDKLINKTGELFRYEELSLAMGRVATGAMDNHRRIAHEMSMEMIGGLNEGAFATLVNDLLDDAGGVDSPEARELEALIERQPISADVKDSVELEDTTRELLHEDLLVLFPGLREMLNEPDTGPITPEDVVPIFEELMKIADLGDEWEVELTDGKGAETSGAAKRVYMGRKHAPLPNRRSAIGLGLHEAVVHGGRSEGLSLSGTLDFEEGLATRLQQIITGARRTPGVQYYLAIGLQAGIDRGGEPRSYRETFEIMWRREVLQKQKTGSDVDIDAARLSAQRHVHRTRRGGAVDTRDASYFVGAQKAASWLNEIAQLPTSERRQALALALTHRYDPTIPEQAEYIKRNT